MPRKDSRKISILDQKTQWTSNILPATMKLPRSDQGADVNVVYVLKRNAKAAKSALETANLLNKKFRMIPAAVAKDCIALPVSDKFNAAQEGPWNEYIQMTGTQHCPYSTAILGNHRQQLEKTSNDNTKSNLTLVQQAILHTIQKLSSSKNVVDEDLISKIQKLEKSVCPKKIEEFGDDRCLVVPPNVFEGEEFRAILCGNSLENEELCRTELWRQLTQIHGSPRIARRGTVDPNSRIRESGHRLLFPYSGIPDMTGPDSPGWIRVTEQKIKQSFDMTRVMFSRGNISEKIRFGKIVNEGDIVLDMYAGIGYYTLPALIHGRASFVHACEWNEHAANALRYNCKDNGVEDRVNILVGDCRIVAQENNLVNMFDRVSLGLLPSSEGGWRTAVRALKRAFGGWLHIHANVPVKEVNSWAFWVCDSLLGIIEEEKLPGNWIVLCDHVEKVKSFAPTVVHVVADIFLGDPKKHPRGSEMHDAKGGMIVGENVCTCPKDIQTPSCALSSDGVLHQEWMRSA